MARLTEEEYSEYQERRKVLVEQLGSATEEMLIARAEGDLRENEGYTAAVTERRNLQGAIDEIDEILNNATLFKVDEDSPRILIGNWVHIQSNVTDFNGKPIDTYKKVAENGNGGLQFLGVDSPLGSLILNAKSGTFKVPGLDITYQVEKVSASEAEEATKKNAEDAKTLDSF